MEYYKYYEDSMRLCETIVKLGEYWENQLQPSSTSSSETVEPNNGYEMMKKKLDKAREKTATLKSEYLEYLARQQTLRLRFIETINVCEQLNSHLGSIVPNSVAACKENSTQNESERSLSNTSGGFIETINVCEQLNSHLGSIVPNSVAACKENSTQNESECGVTGQSSYGNHLTQYSHNLETSILNEHAGEFPASLAASASKSLQVSYLDTNKLNIYISSERNEAPDRSQPNVCNICERNFTRLPDLKRHMITHEDFKPFKCPKCEKSFKLKQHVKKHMVWHEDIRPFKCPKCDKTFKLKQCVKQHMRKMHTDRSQPKVCNICEQNFSCRSALKIHMIAHEDFKPFKCPKCEKTFKLKGNAKKHMISHEDFRPFKCPECDKTFKSTEGVKQHVGQVHIDRSQLIPMICNICKRNFSSVNHLKRHIVNMHENWKRYKCPKCNKSYRCKENAKQHMLQKHSDAMSRVVSVE